MPWSRWNTMPIRSRWRLSPRNLSYLWWWFSCSYRMPVLWWQRKNWRRI